MSRTYTYACTLSWGGDEPTAELEVECSYEVAWGSPPSGGNRPEDCDPGSGDVVECVRILTVEGKPWPVDLSWGYQTPAQDHEMLVDKLLDEHEDAMLTEAREADAADREAAMERIWEERREERFL